jgi:hypothetical protein
MALVGCAAAFCVTGCADDNTAGGNNNNLNQPGVDAGVDAFVQQDAAVVDDPLCPLGQQCADYDEGYMACLLDGEIPPGAQTSCHGGGNCAGNTACFYSNEEQTESVCVPNCGSCPAGTQCGDVTGDGYLGCLDGGYIPSGSPTGCHDGGGCPGNMTCFYTNADYTESACIRNCSSCREGTCPAGEICGPAGICIPEPCTQGSCPTGEICYEGTCIPDIGTGPGPGPGPTCNLPPLECTDGATACGELLQFTPDNNPADAGYDPMLGYIEYPENGETWTNQYRSFLRRDVIMLIKYAAAKTACKAQSWVFGNGDPLGTIDMSEADGAIPGTSIGSPGHPPGTHTDGFDIDMAYYQVNTSNNAARPVCDHYEGGSEAYHCTAAPHLLDPWRTAMFLGSLFEHPDFRVVGVDGKVGPMVEACMDILCTEGWLSGTATCTPSQRPLAYEVTNQGHGWYLFHHHHFHVSFSQPSYKQAQTTSQHCLIDGCHHDALEAFLQARGLAARPLLTPVR